MAPAGRIACFGLKNKISESADFRRPYPKHKTTPLSAPEDILISEAMIV